MKTSLLFVIAVVCVYYVSGQSTGNSTAAVCPACFKACPYGFVQGTNGCPKCECSLAPNPAHPCQNYTLCASSQGCWEKPVTNCNSTSCNPVAQCKVCISCAMACPYGFEMGSDGCPLCKCKGAPDPAHPCKNYTLCASSQVCWEKPVTNCNSTSCNPVAQCKAKVCISCAMACPYGFEMGSNGCPLCKCKAAPDPAHPCKNFSLCATSQVCWEKSVTNCNSTSCNPIAQCKVCISCAMACPYGFEIGSDGCPLCKCKAAPDQTHPCKNYSLCATSQVCWEKPVTNCNSQPCNPVAQCKAKVCISCLMACPYGFEMGADGCPICKCKSAPDLAHPCKNYSYCGSSQVCWEKPVTNCNSPPCNPIAQCKAKVCISCRMACPYGFEMGSDGCPLCKCKPAPDPAHPCKNYSLCASSQVCWEKPVTNCNSTSCNPIAQCKVCISCAMACPYGFEIGSDGCPLCKCKAAPDPTHPCKNYSLCATSQVCWEKPVTNCNSPPCNPVAQCKAKVCISCLMACPYGFEMGADGCPICKCKSAPDPAHPCKNYSYCGSSQVCWEKPVTNCNSPPCNPIAQCKAKVCISCRMACPYGFEMGSDGCPLCKCKPAPDPAHPCKNYSLCASSQVCWEKPVTNCNSTSCNPIAQCKVCISCAMACPYGFEIGSDGCPLCKCKAAPDPTHPCKNYSLCATSQVCWEKQVTNCNSPPCNPVAQCKAKVCISCLMACPYGFEMGADGCPICKCKSAPDPAHPCKNYSYCGSSQVCWEKPVTNCNSPPCNPIAQCKAKVCISCRMACPYGFEMGSDGCPLCKCKPAPDPAHPCKNYSLCASSQVCWEKPVTNCNSTSCNPIAQCKVCISCAMACPYGFEIGSDGCPLCKCKAAPDPTHPCKNYSLCATSQVCWEKPVTNCNSPPCNPVAQCKAKVCISCLMACPYGFEMGADGCPICKCKSAPDPAHPCKNYSYCGSSQVCWEKPVTNCNSPPCNPIAQCKAKVCISCRMACPYGFEMGSDGCPLCKCKPAPDPAHPCKNYSLCASSQVCWEKPVTNCNSTSCNPIAQCKVCISCAMACPYGFEIGSDGCPLCKCKAAPDPTHPCKNYSLCATSQVCWEKPVTNCNSPPCNPVAQCKAKVCISCLMACPYGFEMGADGCPICKCKSAPDPAHPCKNYSYCGSSQVCWEKPVTNCNSPPCNPIAQCKAKVCISCRMACPYGFEMGSDGCPLCKCKPAPDPAHPCKNYSLCASSQVCWEKPVTNCNSTSCNPIAQCKVCISCAMACPYGFEIGSDGCPMCKCKMATDPAHPCKNYSLCATSQVCWEKPVTNCNSPPCNPVAQCKAKVCINCLMACPYGFEMGSDGCPVCKCKSAPDPAHPCKNYTICGKYEVCKEVQVPCNGTTTSSTSCNPVAKCSPCRMCRMACPYDFVMGSDGCPKCECRPAPSPTHPCQNYSLCAPSQVCIERNVTNCNSPPCSPVARCEVPCRQCMMACAYGFVPVKDSYGCPKCECNPIPDPAHPCKNYSYCGSSQVCWEKPVTNCNSPPCNPIAQCKAKVCISCRMACPYGFEMGSDGCPLCKCKPAPDPAHPCKNYSLCASSQVCWEKPVTNCNSTSCNPVAQCKVCISCAMACPYGFEIGSDGCPMCKCKMATDPAHPCKNYSLCATSQVCWEKPVTNCNSPPCNPVAQCKAKVCINCLMACPYGFEMGSDGCPVCKCKSAPDPAHPCKNYTMCGKYEVCKEVQVPCNGTTTSSTSCNPVAKCSPCRMCRMACPYDFVMGSDGCPKCECRPAPNPTHPCQNYSLCAPSQVCMERNLTNCNSPPCNPVARCEVPCRQCMMACAYGFVPVKDSHGCPKCECNPIPDPSHPCKNFTLCGRYQVCREVHYSCNGTSTSQCNPRVVAQCGLPCKQCRMACPYGFVIGSDGCPKCECKSAPNPSHPCQGFNNCPSGYTCKEHYSSCSNPPCRLVPKCERLCPQCRMACPYGFRMGPDGCPLCQCNPAPDPWDPCRGYTGCASGQVCQSKTVQCITSPCYPQPECIKKKLCKSGQPLMDIYNKEIFCGRGLNRQNCPSGYTCNVDPLDRFAVCCPDAVTVRPWRPCPVLPKGYGGGCYTECTTDSECNNKYSAGQMQCCPTDCGFACVYTDIQVNGATTVTSSMLAIVLMIGLMVLRQLRE